MRLYINKPSVRSYIFPQGRGGGKNLKATKLHPHTPFDFSSPLEKPSKNATHTERNTTVTTSQRGKGIP